MIIGMRWIGVMCAALVVCGAAEARADSEQTEFKICIQPLGKYDKKLAKVAAKGVTYLYGFDVEILDKKKMPKSAYYKPRKRWRADKLLDYLETIVPDDCKLLIGFTDLDISTTKGNIKDWGIFGLATIGGPTGVVSSHRLHRRASRKKLGRRTINVFNHELGHALGMPHVPKKGCLMQDAAGTIKSVDGESGLLCKGSIEKIERKNGITLPVRTEFDWDAVLSK